MRHPKHFILGALVGAALGGGGIPAKPALAQSAAISTRIDVASRQWRIGLAEKLSLLNRIVGADACYIAQGADGQTVRNSLHKAQLEVSSILGALADGNAQLGIPEAETDRATRDLIRDLSGAWRHIDTALAELSAGERVEQNLAIILRENSTLDEKARLVAAKIGERYGSPDKMSMTDTMAVNVARRQRGLTQELRRTICAIAVGGTALARSREDFITATTNFENSLMALRNGMPTVGIAPPPDDGIAAELDRALERWYEVKPVLLSVALSGEAGADRLDRIGELTASLQLNMDNVVTRYLIATLGDDDIYKIPLRSYAETELAQWFADPAIISAVKSQNARTASMTQAQIDALDQQWREETASDASEKPLISAVLSRPASGILAQHQTDAAGFVTEVFVMDNRGLNVAQSTVTSDIWQGDEDKWLEVVGNGSGQIHISEVEFDDSTQAYQAQVSLPIKDPETEELIGGVTLGVNVQFLL